MNPVDIINELYAPGSALHTMLMEHNRRVARKALEIAEKVPHLNPDVQFIEEAAMLHDIGIFMTDVPPLCCHGDHPYIRHGILGRAILEARGFHRHALVCERHVGVGITAGDIGKHRLPLPVRDMRPRSTEEEIIAYADKFYSKDCQTVVRENSLEEITAGLERHGREKAEIFRAWVKKYEGNGNGNG
ncbi:phosphohydrolase [Desulfonema ishimotonii]|uniref:Phosphohydrolase n=1 Tax=Desulfonema ishimotonii TaxID=45657 RepID=A0A401G1G9_9BACT|nr:HD domain-containing protein [Desulfonema ishimotonii]GBC63055.1 phosphohydrolase [Desulfonema ishimotonii]